MSVVLLGRWQHKEAVAIERDKKNHGELSLRQANCIKVIVDLFTIWSIVFHLSSEFLNKIIKTFCVNKIYQKCLSFFVELHNNFHRRVSLQ